MTGYKNPVDTVTVESILTEGVPQLPDLSDLSHAEKDALIRALWQRLEAAERRIAELEARLGEPSKTPDNSSLPPSKGQKQASALRSASDPSMAAGWIVRCSRRFTEPCFKFGNPTLHRCHSAPNKGILLCVAQVAEVRKQQQPRLDRDRVNCGFSSPSNIG